MKPGRRRFITAALAVTAAPAVASSVTVPGMDGPEYNGRKEAYDVLLVRRDGSTTSYQSYP